MRVLLYANLLKETETEETILFFVTFLSLVEFRLGGRADPLSPLLATSMSVYVYLFIVCLVVINSSVINPAAAARKSEKKY